MSEFIVKINKKTLAVTIEADGFNGVGCLSATDALQKVLKMTTTSEEQKPEINYAEDISYIQQR